MHKRCTIFILLHEHYLRFKWNLALFFNTERKKEGERERERENFTGHNNISRAMWEQSTNNTLDVAGCTEGTYILHQADRDFNKIKMRM